MYRQWGGFDLINMSVVPKAKLAREGRLGAFCSMSSIIWTCVVMFLVAK